MRVTIRKRLDMAQRVLEFCRANAAPEPSYAEKLSRLEAAIDKADRLARQQLSGEAIVRASTQHRRDLRRALHDQLRHLARVGDVVARSRPDLAHHFQLPLASANGQAYRTAARAMLEEATAQRDLLLQHGMASTLLDDLAAAVKQYDASVEQASAGRRAHIGAVAELAVVSSDIMETVEYFDGLHRYRFRTNADLRAEWESARNIVAFPRSGGPEEKKPAA